MKDLLKRHDEKKNFDMKRVFVVCTGQLRCFLTHTWDNLVSTLLSPLEREGFSVFFVLCLDADTRFPHVPWTDDQEKKNVQQRFLDLWNTWSSSSQTTHSMMLLWVHRNDALMTHITQRLDRMVRQSRLSPHVFHYLVGSSGSCIEYVQLSRSLEILSSFVGQGGQDDLFIRTRTDVIFGHPWSLNRVQESVDRIRQSDESSICPSQQLIGCVFPTFSQHESLLQYKAPDTRESHFFHPYTEDDTRSRWVLVLRKNLVYVMPWSHSRVLLGVADTYGDWDTADMNEYWWNAESQFRGCLRQHHFSLFHYEYPDHELYITPHEDSTTSEKTDRLYVLIRGIK